MLPKRSTLISGSASAWKKAGLGGWPVSSSGALNVTADVTVFDAGTAADPASSPDPGVPESRGAKALKRLRPNADFDAPPGGAATSRPASPTASAAAANNTTPLRREKVLMADSCLSAGR